MDTRSVIIYTLSNPINNEVFYVGRTTLTLQRRLQSHNIHAEGTPQYIIYMHELKKAGLRPVIEYVYSCTWDERKNIEEFWIQTFSMCGFPLTNKKHVKNKNYVSYKEVQRKRNRSFILKTVDPDILELIYLLYNAADTIEISKRLGCTHERIRAMMDKNRRTKSNKLMEWVKPVIEKFYLEKGKFISDTYLKTIK